jgi:hypothetical protein
MNNQVPKYVTQARASLMLGIPEAELSRISKESGLGHVECAGNEEETYFTYEELQRICMLAAPWTLDGRMVAYSEVIVGADLPEAVH